MIDISKIKERFRCPSVDCKPFVRWWWFGGAVTEEELAWELEQMAKTGMGGVEIQPVYPLSVDKPEKNIVNTLYLSPRWMELLKFTVKKAKELGMIVDMAFGSGWPFGGPHIPRELAARRLRYSYVDVRGPSSFEGKIPGEIEQGERVVCLLAANLVGDRLEEESITDLTNLISEEGTFSWAVPKGTWRIMSFIEGYTGQMVKRATVGSEGYVLDHLNFQALQRHIDWVGKKVKKAVGREFGHTFRAMFCDSWEVFNANWTQNFLKKFEARRGYSLKRYLPALWNDIGKKTSCVRYDYSQTVSELILENFFRPFISWCSQNGLLARVQAHGTQADLLSSYGLAHIPEGETSRLHSSSPPCKLASSAAHIYGRKVCSAESFTWLPYYGQLPFCRFLATMEQIKAETDALFQDGINHIVHHGYPYSPRSIGSPGWVFYASIMCNHNNTWWKYYKSLADYMGRASYLLRQGVFVSDICVYGALADTWAYHLDVEKGIYYEFETMLKPGICHTLYKNGYNFDLINDNVLTHIARAVDGKLVLHNASYSVLVLPNVISVPIDVLDKIKAFCLSGGVVIATHRLPESTCGFSRFEERSQRVKDMVNDLFGSISDEEAIHINKFGKGYAYYVRDEDALIEIVRRYVPPDFLLSKSDEDIAFIHRRVHELDIYFISNLSERPKKCAPIFRVGKKTPEIWDAMSGEIRPAFCYLHNSNGTQVFLELDPYGSIFVLFKSHADLLHVTGTNVEQVTEIKQDEEHIEIRGLVRSKGDYFVKTNCFEVTTQVKEVLPVLELDGTWRLTFEGIEDREREVFTLSSWTDYPQFRYFSGSALYEQEVIIPPEYLEKKVALRLDLGEVHEIAEVLINGQLVDVCWKRPRVLKITKYIKKGKNKFQIRVTNLLINKVLGQEMPDYTELEKRYGRRFPLPQEKKSLKEPLISGLLGPVRIIPYRKICFKKYWHSK